MKNNSFLEQGFIVISIICITFISQYISAHGYVLKPESRNYACKLNKNKHCGNIIWEPQSLEGSNQFPQSGPANGRIASANLSQFSELNQQSATRWVKTPMPNGVNEFTWQFTARHVTKGWRYFLTKPNWNTNAPLTRHTFDFQPFCTADGQYRQPAERVTHRCSIPSDRTGYHVILAIWDIGDTTNSFYNMIDVQLGSGQPITAPQPEITPPSIEYTWQDIGDINPIDDLKPNDKVKIRVFEHSGENLTLATELIIRSHPQGQRNHWTRDLAEKINREHNVLRAGKKDASGNIHPVLGKNNIFTLPHSHIERVEVKIERTLSASIIPNTTTQYDFIYPQNIQRYKAGTKVLASNGLVYQCKSYPYSGWCTIYSYHYIPGTGSNWQDAWIPVN